MDLLAFRSNIKPEALRQKLWLVTHFSTILMADPERFVCLAHQASMSFCRAGTVARCIPRVSP